MNYIPEYRNKTYIVGLMNMATQTSNIYETCNEKNQPANQHAS